jgi:hypothetical protein
VNRLWIPFHPSNFSFFYSDSHVVSALCEHQAESFFWHAGSSNMTGTGGFLVATLVSLCVDNPGEEARRSEKGNRVFGSTGLS